MKNKVFLVIGMLMLCGCKGQDVFRNGDLIFCVGKEEAGLGGAVKRTTGKADEMSFSHVGIINKERGQVFVIEAIGQGVVRRPLGEFLAGVAKEDGRYLAKIGRVKAEFAGVAEKAVERAKVQVGKGYDWEFDEGNDKFYCSELVRFCYIDDRGEKIFKPLKMSFKNKKTGEIDTYWVEHFAKMGKEVPEGKDGTNPYDMSKSEVVEMREMGIKIK